MLPCQGISQPWRRILTKMNSGQKRLRRVDESKSGRKAGLAYKPDAFTELNEGSAATPLAGRAGLRACPAVGRGKRTVFQSQKHRMIQPNCGAKSESPSLGLSPTFSLITHLSLIYRALLSHLSLPRLHSLKTETVFTF